MDLLTVPDCGQYLKRSPGAIRMMVLRGLIPYRRVGGRLMFIRSEIDQWIEGCEGARVEEAVKANKERTE